MSRFATMKCVIHTTHTVLQVVATIVTVFADMAEILRSEIDDRDIVPATFLKMTGRELTSLQVCRVL